MRTVKQQKRITREDLRARPEVWFLFGDNLLGIGMGGQAGAMRGEPNAIGVPTKRAPGGDAGDYFSDDDFALNCAAISEALARVPEGATVVVPSDGLGTGLAELPKRAPRTFAYLEEQLRALAGPVEKVLVLRTCDANRRSRGEFQWPEVGPVSAPDWSPRAVCGYGLHGWLWGEGDGSLGKWDADAKWLVVEVERAALVDLKGKVKFPRGTVMHCGDRGTATAGDRGTATAGDGGTATAGYGGTATAGDRGTATAGYGGTATAGDGGTATAGDGGTLLLVWWDENKRKWRKAMAEVGENGIKPNVPYKLKDGKFVEAPVESVAA